MIKWKLLSKFLCIFLPKKPLCHWNSKSFTEQGTTQKKANNAKIKLPKLVVLLQGTRLWLADSSIHLHGQHLLTMTQPCFTCSSPIRIFSCVALQIKETCPGRNFGSPFLFGRKRDYLICNQHLIVAFHREHPLLWRLFLTIACLSHHFWCLY